MIDPIYVVAREGESIGVIFTDEQEARDYQTTTARKHPGQYIHFCPSIGAERAEPPERVQVKSFKVGP